MTASIAQKILFMACVAMTLLSSLTATAPSKQSVSDPMPEAFLNKRKLPTSVATHPIKFHVDTSNVKGISAELREYLVKLVVKEGNKVFASKISLRNLKPTPIRGNASIKYQCGYDSIVKIPSEYGYQTYEADFILFIATDDTGNDGTLAYATSCYKGLKKRPIAGFAVFNPYYMKVENGKLDNDIATYVHEVLHALIFSSDLWKNFPRVNGKSQYYLSRGNHYLRGPNLLQTARDHFGCQQLPGVPLEDDGGAGSKGGHFERLVFGDETMVAEDVGIAKFSKMTLALLADSQWYEIDMNKGDYYTWGKGEGCDIFMKSSSKLASVEEVCIGNNNFGCDKTFKYKMTCKGSTFTGKQEIKTKGSNCLKPNSKIYFFEHSSINSKCQEFSYQGTNYSACVHIKCATDDNSYTVTLGNTNTPNNSENVRYICKNENQVFRWGNSFKFKCENPKVICSSLCPKDCNHRGKCMDNGQCDCDPFYSGAICGTFNGCEGLSTATCARVKAANNISEKKLSNSFDRTDYNPNYASLSSWNNARVLTDTGIDPK